MVNLILNPKGNNILPVKGKNSKKNNNIIIKVPNNLNPFEEGIQNFENNNIIQSKTLLIDKYHPNGIKDLIGLDSSYYYLKKWYFSLSENGNNNSNNNKVLIVIGEIGSGKTSLVHIFCKEEGILLLDSNNINNTDLEDSIHKFVHYSVLFANNEKYKLILLDNYINDTIIQNIIKNNKGLPPIIIIPPDNKGSKLSELKKIYEVHYINNITNIKYWIKNIITLEKINISDSHIEIVLSKCKSDKRFILNTLEFIKKNGNEKIELFLLDYYKDSEIDIFKFINKLFDNIELINISEIYNAYDTDGYSIANLVHENYIDFNDSIESISESADHISHGEVIVNKLYSSTQFFSPEFHCLESIIYPSYYSRSDFKKNKEPLRSPYINNRLNILINNKKIIDKLGLDIFTFFIIKSFLNYDLVKSKELSPNQEEYLLKIMSLLKYEISLLEMIYKYFNNYFGKKDKNNVFTKKFKEKLVVICNKGKNNGI
jgi:hypothetical protein